MISQIILNRHKVLGALLAAAGYWLMMRIAPRIVVLPQPQDLTHYALYVVTASIGMMACVWGPEDLRIRRR
jgi:hypothetical protein